MSSDIVSTLQINKRMHSIQEQQISQQHQVSYTSILSSAVRPIKIAGSFKYSEFKLLVLTIPSSRCRITPGELIGKYTYIYIKSYIFQWLILPFFFFLVYLLDKYSQGKMALSMLDQELFTVFVKQNHVSCPQIWLSGREKLVNRKMLKKAYFCFCYF